MTTSTTAPRPTARRPSAPSLLDQLAEARAALIGRPRGSPTRSSASEPTASALCLGGLLKHVASMEEQWMRFAVEGPVAMGIELPDGVTWQDLFAGTRGSPRSG